LQMKMRRGSIVVRLCIPQNCPLGHAALMQDYFSEVPTYPHPSSIEGIKCIYFSNLITTIFVIWMIIMCFTIYLIMCTIISLFYAECWIAEKAWFEGSVCVGLCVQLASSDLRWAES
jgi:hypothetical protein